MTRLVPIVLALSTWLAAAPALADEGMWTFDDFPSNQVERSLGVRLDKGWLAHLQATSVRLTSGCSASAGRAKNSWLSAN